MNNEMIHAIKFYHINDLFKSTVANGTAFLGHCTYKT